MLKYYLGESESPPNEYQLSKSLNVYDIKWTGGVEGTIFASNMQ